MEFDNVKPTDDPMALAAIGAVDEERSIKRMREVLDIQTMNSVRILLEAIQEGREGYKGDPERYEQSQMSMSIRDFEIFLSKLAAVSEILG